MAGFLEKFCKRNLTDIMMFSWVYCLRMNLPNATIENAILNFMKYNGKTEDDINVLSETVKYRRMEAEYRELQKIERKEKEKQTT